MHALCAVAGKLVYHIACAGIPQNLHDEVTKLTLWTVNARTNPLI